jgi:lipopolysaccharide assembly outer membrane protein LptD (OstA)
MICRLFVLLSLVFLPVCLYAQANQSNSGNPLADLNPTEPGGKFSQSPVEITAEGQTRYEGGVAIAEHHVVIHYGDVAIYCEYAEYNPETHDVLVKERVRLYRGDYAFACDRAVYNL